MIVVLHAEHGNLGGSYYVASVRPGAEIHFHPEDDGNWKVVNAPGGVAGEEFILVGYSDAVIKITDGNETHELPVKDLVTLDTKAKSVTLNAGNEGILHFTYSTDEGVIIIDGAMRGDSPLEIKVIKEEK